MGKPEILLRPEELAEHFGIGVAPREYGVQIMKLNVASGPVAGTYLNREDVLRYLEKSSQSLGGSDQIDLLCRELREATGG